MEFLADLLKLVGPTLVSILTVPIMGGIKKAVSVIDNLSPTLKRIVVIVIAFLLTQLGHLVNVQLPDNLSMFTESNVQALLSAALAMTIHAGNKLSEKK